LDLLEQARDSRAITQAGLSGRQKAHQTLMQAAENGKAENSQSRNDENSTWPQRAV
jgi:hypothetical protein